MDVSWMVRGSTSAPDICDIVHDVDVNISSCSLGHCAGAVGETERVES